MKKSLAALFVFFSVCFSLHTQEAGLPPWAARERRNLARTRQALTDLDLPFEERALLESFGGFGTSVFVRINGSGENGEDPDSGGTFVLALPLQADFAVETGLAFIEAAKNGRPVSNLLVAFLADEGTGLPPDAGGLSHKGFRDLLSTADMPESWALCFLDLNERPEGIQIRHGNGEYIAPLEILRPLPRLFSARNIRAEFEIRYNELYRLDLAVRNEELALAWEAGVNALSLGPSKETGGGKITPGRLAELLLYYSREMSLPILNPERYYSFYSSPIISIFIGETASVLILIVLVGLLLFFILFYFTRLRRRTIFGLKFFFRYFWVFVLFLPSLVLAIKGSCLLYGLLLSLFEKPVPEADFTGIFLSALLGIACFAVLLKMLKVLKIPAKGNFYGFSALFMSFLGLSIGLFLDFTYAPIFLWAVFFSFWGFFSPKPLQVFIAALLIPVQAIDALFNLYDAGVLIPPGVFQKFLGLENWTLGFQISLMTLPSLLLLKKFVLIVKLPKRKKNLRDVKVIYRTRPGVNIPLPFYAGFSGIVAFSLFLYSMSRPGPGPSPVRRSIEDDGTRLAVSLDDTVFQESRILQLNVKAPGSPVRFDISLEGGGENRAVVYSVPAPLEENNGRLSLILGENPPNPFHAQLVLSKDFSGIVKVEALYTNAAEITPPLPDADETSGTEQAFGTKADYLLRLWGTRQIPAEPTS